MKKWVLYTPNLMSALKYDHLDVNQILRTFFYVDRIIHLIGPY